MRTSFYKSLLIAITFSVSGFAQAQSQSSAAPLEVVQQFYEAFAKLDYKTMGSFYEKDLTNIFADPVFGTLNTQETRAMWAMLTLSSLSYSKQTGVPPLQVSYHIVAVEGDLVKINWIAEYVFSETGRKVTNPIHTIMRIQNGKIVGERDYFDLCSWTKMAFGFPKSLVCYAPSIIRKNVRKKLADFMEKMPQLN
jgi:ketosteroid isomerase-like protein